MKKNKKQLSFLEAEESQMQAEKQIQEEQRVVNYDTREYTVELIVQKYSVGRESNENELFVPAYQRAFTWKQDRQSKFIESVLLGLPIPFIFTADSEGRLEIVDGSQRIRCLANFVHGGLELSNLKKLDLLNGKTFNDLPLSRQRRFNRQTLRMIELTDKANEQVRQDIFERINTGSDSLREMEKRKGIYASPFYAFVSECATVPLFRKLCPLGIHQLDREEGPELVLRYFAYAEKYRAFEHSVTDFLNAYMESRKLEGAEFPREQLWASYLGMLNFVDKYIPNGFAKGPKSKSTPRVRFEALSVGVHLALQERPNLVPRSFDWISSDKFRSLTRSDASNSRTRVKDRIEYVRDQLLAN